jgi:beta-glucanase (GH16 family)
MKMIFSKAGLIVACLAAFVAPLMAGDVLTDPGGLNLNLTNTSPHGGRTLVWSDEFNQPDGTAPDITKWGYDLGGKGWGNHELEYYTSNTNNVRIENGKLVIEARKESFGGRNYTSARLQTRGKWSWTYGRVEARIKVPHGQGFWPAFWMLGTNINSVGWPACGEIDIMENLGREPGMIHGTVHGPGYSGTGGIGGPFALPGGAAFADDFHVFAIECEMNRIRWFVDNQPYFTVTPASLPRNTQWVFNQPKFLLLNLAVGGGWPGNPDGTTTFPQRMLVDYVRVYDKAPPLAAQAPSSPSMMKMSN